MTRRPDKVVVPKGIAEQGLATFAGGEAVCKLTVGNVHICSSEVIPEPLSDPLFVFWGLVIFFPK